MSDQPPKTTCGKKPVCDFGGQPGQPHPLSLTLLCLSRSNLLLCCQLCPCRAPVCPCGTPVWGCSPGPHGCELAVGTHMAAGSGNLQG